MVKLDKIEDEETFNGSVVSEVAAKVEEQASESEEESDSELEDDYDENETIFERIQALGEIFSPGQKELASSAYSYTASTISSLFSKAGSGLWILTTSALLLGVPIAAGILGETQLMELEKELNLQQNAGGLSPASADPLLQSEPEKN